jgi:alanine racemase
MSKFSRWGINRECNLLFDVLLYFEYDEATIQNRMELYPVEMLESQNGINNCSIIDDSYSSDFQSLK